MKNIVRKILKTKLQNEKIFENHMSDKWLVYRIHISKILKEKTTKKTYFLKMDEKLE